MGDKKLFLKEASVYDNKQLVCYAIVGLSYVLNELCWKINGVDKVDGKMYFCGKELI